MRHIKAHWSVDKQEIGGYKTVRKVIPQVQKLSIGPFVHLTHSHQLLGDAIVVDERHYAGIELIDYNFSGDIEHIYAGSGCNPNLRTQTTDDGPVNNIRLWSKLSKKHEFDEPYEENIRDIFIPRFRLEDGSIKLIAGVLPAFNQTPGAVRFSDKNALVAHIVIYPGCHMSVDLPEGIEVGFYVISGQGFVSHTDCVYASGDVGVLQNTNEIQITNPSHENWMEVFLFGGSLIKDELFFRGSYVFHSEKSLALAQSEYFANHEDIRFVTEFLSYAQQDN